MKNIAVFGSGGFIGKNTVNYLKRFDNNNVFAISHQDVDLLCANDVEYFIRQNKIDVIIHCANTGGTRKNIVNNQVVENNLRMFFNLEHCLQQDMLMISFGSGAQYNKSRNLIKVDEKTIQFSVPADSYGYSKYIISRYIQARSQQCGNGKCINPVIFGMFGIGEDYEYRFISNAIIKNILKMPIVINQDVVFDYLYIKDYFKVLDKILDNTIDMTEFNLTPTESISLTNIAKLINEVGSYKSDIIVRNSGLNYQYTGSNQLLMSQIGYDFKFTPYIDAIEQMYHYYAKHIGEMDLSAVIEDRYVNRCQVKNTVNI